MKKTLIIGISLFAVVLFQDITYSKKRSDTGITIAVMQFDDQSIGTREYRAWNRGLPEQIMQSLGTIPDFTVVSRGTMLKKIIQEQQFQLTGMTDQSSAVKIGEMLNVQYICTGSFSVFKDKLRINSQVVSVQSGKVVCQKSVLGTLDDFWELQNQIAMEIANGLNVKLSQEKKDMMMASADTKNINASIANYEGESRLEEFEMLKEQKDMELKRLKEEEENRKTELKRVKDEEANRKAELERIKKEQVERLAESKRIEKERIKKEREARKAIEAKEKQQREEELRRIVEEQTRRDEEARQLAEEKKKQELEAQRLAEEKRLSEIEAEKLAKEKEAREEEAGRLSAEKKKMEKEAKKMFEEALKNDENYERAKKNMKKLAHAIPMTL